MSSDDTVRDQHPWARRIVLAWGVLLGVHTALVFAQAVLAGQLLSGGATARSVHSVIGDDVLPFVALAMLVVALLVIRPARGPSWPALASLVLLVADVVQLALGFAGRLDLHVPLGVGIFGLSIVLLPVAVRLLRRYPATGPARRSPVA